ncbi:MAG: hypothetical protein AMS16_02870, partial [Planctomycetes bacterium DG_58]
SEDEFLAALPDLRLAFADLTPREIDRVSVLVAGFHGEEDLGELVHHDVTEEEFQFHVHITRAVGEVLAAQGLGAMSADSSGDSK